MPREAIAGVTLDVYVAVSARALKLGLTAEETRWRSRIAHDALVRAEYTRRYPEAATK